MDLLSFNFVSHLDQLIVHTCSATINPESSLCKEVVSFIFYLLIYFYFFPKEICLFNMGEEKGRYHMDYSTSFFSMDEFSLG